jgi:hypothetical protein
MRTWAKSAMIRPGFLFVGHRQGVAGGGLADAGVIALGIEDGQTGFGVAQNFPLGH